MLDVIIWLIGGLLAALIWMVVERPARNFGVLFVALLLGPVALLIVMLSVIRLAKKSESR